MVGRAVGVLCIDDDRVITAIVEIALSADPDIRLHTAQSGDEALELMERGLMPDLILLDANLPDASGAEIARRLIERDPDHSPPIVFMTASSEYLTAEQCRKAGAVGVIPKPFDPVTLAAQVRAFLPD